jgi:endonuclease I
MKKTFPHIIFLLLLFSVKPLLYAQPANYYDPANGLSGAALKTALHGIIDDHTVKSYDYLWTAFYTTDDKANGKVWDMYSDVPGGTPSYEYTFGTNQCGNYNSEGDCYNREHSFPASWFNDGAPMYTDLFHLVPTDGWVNNKRGSFPFGETTNPTYTSSNESKVGTCSVSGYSGTVFEPIDEYKGDFARNYFYMATRYENVIAGWYNNSTEADAVLMNNSFPVFETWFLNMLGEWHTDDPVSQKEIDRNNAIFDIQQNRNPFIDHPEYVYEIWEVGAPSLAPEPTNHAADFSAHCITLNWEDATGATVPNAYLVRMSSSGFADIDDPTDGIAVSDNFSNQNINYGIRKAIFGGLNPGTLYYFKIFGYVGSGSTIDYKTDGSVQQVSIEAR